ncbi:MAG TPA: type II toxin-antitoxin system HipA family toxin, partial [Humisphaera sp.]|nr:type II toxin-antitoxin system HipA family toxin [Humisphaera sp.]
FEYDASFIERELPLSPFKLPLRAGMIEHADVSFGRLPGLFDDSLPDGWGLLLMDRMFRRRGLDPVAVSPLERLSYLGVRTMGALTYHPPEDVKPDNALIDLHKMGENARQIYSGQAVEILPELMRAGGSPGGARPKALIGLKNDKIISGEDDLPAGYKHWIVKFPSDRDGRDAGRVEFAYAAMARAAGIDMPATKLFRVAKTQAYFGAQRFDRGPKNRRRHLHTFGNLIHANFRIPTTDYADLFKVTIALTRNHADLLRAFARMAFNVAAHNRDDHAKNFSFLMADSGDWSLSPAYDLTFSAGPGGEHTMTIAGEGRSPTRDHMLQLAGQFDIKRKDANAIIDKVARAVSKWNEFAERAGCTKKTACAISARLQPV